MQGRNFFPWSGRAAPVLLSVLLALSWPRPASAILVFDPLNFGQTLITAINAAKQTWAQYQQLRQQFQQLQQEAHQLQSIDPEGAAHLLARLPSQGALQDLEAASTATADLVGTLGQVQDNFSRRLDEARVAERSWPDYERLIAAQIARRDQAALARVAAEKQMERQVEFDFATARDLGDRISGTAGTHEAQQLMNIQLNQLLRQHALMNEQLAKYVGGHEAERMQEQTEDRVRLKAAQDDDHARGLSSRAADQAAIDEWLAKVQGRMTDSANEGH